MLLLQQLPLRLRALVPRRRAGPWPFSRFSTATRSATVRDASPGLFQLPSLHAPEDFYRLTEDAKRTCHALRDEMAAAAPGIATVRLLDDISNAICCVIDAAELCRNVHPSAAYRRAASDCYTELSDFIQNLNADVELYRALRSVSEDAALMRGVSEERRRMAVLLRKEYERDGIHLPLAGRRRVIALQKDITRLSMDFQRTLFSARAYVEVPARLLRPLPHSVWALCERKLSNPLVLRVPTDVHVMNTVLKWVGDPTVRRDMYVAANSCAVQNLETLEELRAKRHELAQLLGFESYAHLATSDRMIGSPEAVEKFIQDISRQLMGKARVEHRVLLEAKRKHEGSGARELCMWDVPYYMGMLKAQQFRIDSRVISGYFPLERCLDGLHLLCSALFGVDLTQVDMPRGSSEAWHEDVRKLALTRHGETLGHIYFDLYPREHKYTHAAHFTIRCGKRLSDRGAYQTPIVALVCNFNKPAPFSPSLLTHSEVETLFHEFGHALHSLLSQTEFQHLSGTRAQLDFVETPSHLFEYFAWDPRVVREFARHHETNEPIPTDMMRSLRASKHMFAAMDTQTQCLYSLLDLSLFGAPSSPGSPPHVSTSSSTDLLAQLQNATTLVPHVDGTFWHTRFGHLIGYGAGYYSYLYARVFAADIWGSCFQEDPLSRAAGEQLFQKLMVHGGAKDPHEMLTDLVGRRPTPAMFLSELGIDTTG